MVTTSTHADAVERRFVEHEHLELVAGLDRITEVAELTDRLGASALGWALSGLVHWLESSVEPHMAWEEEWLYPRLNILDSSGWPTQMLSFEHEQIRCLIAEIALDRQHIGDAPSPRGLIELRRRLYGVDALIRAHLACEDRFVLPALDDPMPRLPSVKPAM